MKYPPVKNIRHYLLLAILLVNMILFVSVGTAQKLSETTDTVATEVEVVQEELPPDTTIGAPVEYDEEFGGTDDKEYFDLKSLHEYDDDKPEKINLPDSVLKQMRADDDFWYANYDFVKEKEKEKKEEASSQRNNTTPFFQREWVRTLVWLLIIAGFAIALMLYLEQNNVALFRKPVKSFKDEKPPDDSDNIFEINYRERIDKAVKEGNFRLAVRLQFLQMLKTLSGKNIIQYRQERTNFDYLMQLKPTAYYHDFFKLTRSYEFSWYGNFAVSEQTYTVIKNDFEKFDNGLKR